MDAVKTHDSFEKYSELKEEKAKNELNDTERKVKYDRFLRVADHIICVRTQIAQTVQDFRSSTISSKRKNISDPLNGTSCISIESQEPVIL